MEFILIFLAIIFLIDIVAIFLVLEEDLFYSKDEKFNKVIFILFVPIIGAFIEIYKVNKLSKVSKNKDVEASDTKWYHVWSESSSDGGGGGGD